MIILYFNDDLFECQSTIQYTIVLLYCTVLANKGKGSATRARPTGNATATGMGVAGYGGLTFAVDRCHVKMGPP